VSHTAILAAQHGEGRAIHKRGWSQAISRLNLSLSKDARRVHEQNPWPGRWSWPTGCVRPDTRQRGRHHRGAASAAPPKRLIADKAYDARSLRDWLKSHRVIALIPSTAARTVPDKHSRIAYRWPNRIERLFGSLKNWPRAATHHDRLACNDLAAVALVSCVMAGA
jgi:hypothetical protein